MIEPIVDAHSHRLALRRVEELWNADPGSPEAQELDALATLIDAYERKHVPIAPPDAIAAIEARCEQLGWTRKELEPLIGSKARVSEVLGRKRALTLPMIRRIHTAMQIPAEVLIAHSVSRRPPPRRTSKQGGAAKGAKRAA